MKHNSFLVICFLLLTGSFIISCEKEGPAGPAGAQGPQGTPGSAGAPGPTGPAGPAGSANVIYSNWTDVVYEEDTVDGGWFGEMEAVKLDSAMLATGEMRVYANAGTASNPVVISLPYGQEILPIFVKGGIVLSAADDYSTYINAGQRYWQYRYILIPGGTRGQNGLKIDWDNYKQVQATLGIVN